MEDIEHSLVFHSAKPWAAYRGEDPLRNVFIDSGQRAQQIPDQLQSLLSEACEDLRTLNPHYIGFVSSVASFPIELIGNPALATQYAVGRLSGPDLLSTSLLITEAALSEDFNRQADIFTVLAESSDAVPERILPGAKAEVIALDKLFSRQMDVQTVFINGDNDLSDFLRRIEQANIIHFAGHGQYDDLHLENCGLVFREGILNPHNLSLSLAGRPIVFSNACETGLISRKQNSGEAWTGLAAAFISCGAVNYLGSLWAIFDEGSRQLAEIFYHHIYDGKTVGDALLAARLSSYKNGDFTWAAFVLFGCPRNRLKVEPSK
jgi:CHAT domain-containing protein